MKQFIRLGLLFTIILGMLTGHGILFLNWQNNWMSVYPLRTLRHNEPYLLFISVKISKALLVFIEKTDWALF